MILSCLFFYASKSLQLGFLFNYFRFVHFLLFLTPDSPLQSCFFYFLIYSMPNNPVQLAFPTSIISNYVSPLNIQFQTLNLSLVEVILPQPQSEPSLSTGFDISISFPHIQNYAGSNDIRKVW